MSPTATRLLLLGGVRLFEPVNGYQLRRELLSWRVEEWAHVNPGSIYTGLATLARQGHLLRHDLHDAERTVAVYTTTDGGQAEFDRLFDDAVRTVDQSSPAGLYAALAMASMVTRERLSQLLGSRLVELHRLTAEYRASALVDPATLPPHLSLITDLWGRQLHAERDWATDCIERLGRGEAAFLGEGTAWLPPPEDPGWQLARDRERYRDLLDAGLSSRR